MYVVIFEDGSRKVNSGGGNLRMAEDGSLVPASFYGQGSGGGGGGVPQGYTRAEDGSIVPESFYGR